MKSKDKKDKNNNGIPDDLEEAIFGYMVSNMLRAILLIAGIYIAGKVLGLY